ncbi:hypothetical protein FRC03_001110 [Tulasnella sp. 419]|nr:hypothetical protein FRC02_006768 [Tulasnella sp. 418]KAG8969765.1 hypothetical protein FRC03_001110 [Tulasnella sp. 419]
MPPPKSDRWKGIEGAPEKDPIRDPRKSPHPDDPLSEVFIIAPLVTVFACCLLFLLYRRASILRYVIEYQLKSWTNRGRIRLPDDDGSLPPQTVAGTESDEEETPVHSRPVQVS